MQGGYRKKDPVEDNEWKYIDLYNYLPWTSPLNTWLFPARVASHSTEERRICESEITTCFISGLNMGSSSTHCFASIAIYAQKANSKINEEWDNSTVKISCHLSYLP